MEFVKRKSPRIPGFSYGTPNYYFITICTQNKECIFGMPEIQTEAGKIAEKYLLKIPQIYDHIILDKYVVMPNHIHCIFVIQQTSGRNLPTLPVIIGQYKASVTKEIRKKHPRKIVWQRSFHDHIIRDRKSYEKIWMYIDTNPLKWEMDCFWCKEQTK